MKIDLEHFHYWMCAIRESNDYKRTLDAFWRGQLCSKEWLIEELLKQTSNFKSYPTIDIHGGWVGVLASLLFQSEMNISHINNIDVDPSCKSISQLMNQIEYQAGKFHAHTQDMCIFQSNADIIINTSFEHINQEQYNFWLDNLPQQSLIILQSNNYEILEHIRIAKDLEEFKQQAKLKYIYYSGELILPLYTRFMIIGKK